MKPHDDGHSWHARRMNTKVYLPLWGNARCVNRCMDDEVVMRVGEAWTFDNTLQHSVENNGDTERATLIVSMRTEPRAPVVRQPETGLHLYAGSFVKSHVVPDAGTVMPQHSHSYGAANSMANDTVSVGNNVASLLAGQGKQLASIYDQEAQGVTDSITGGLGSFSGMSGGASKGGGLKIG